MDDPFEGGIGSVITTSIGRYDGMAVAITSAVVTATKLGPLEPPPLSNIGVGPKVLDVLFHPSHSPSRRLSFQYAGRLVSPFDDGTLIVHPFNE